MSGTVKEARARKARARASSKATRVGTTPKARASSQARRIDTSTGVAVSVVSTGTRSWTAQERANSSMARAPSVEHVFT